MTTARNGSTTRKDGLWAGLSVLAFIAVMGIIHLVQTYGASDRGKPSHKLPPKSASYYAEQEANSRWRERAANNRLKRGNEWRLRIGPYASAIVGEGDVRLEVYCGQFGNDLIWGNPELNKRLDRYPLRIDVDGERVKVRSATLLRSASEVEARHISIPVLERFRNGKQVTLIYGGFKQSFPLKGSSAAIASCLEANS